MKKSEAKKAWELIEQWTRAEIISRLGRFDSNVGFADYYQIMLEKKDEIRELVFGTSDLLVLGERWGILKKKRKRGKKSGSHSLNLR